MAAIAEFLAETTTGQNGDRFAFEDALAGLRVEGSVMLHGTHTSPWAVAVPGAAQIHAMLGLSADAIAIPFHLVLKGDLHLQFPDHAGVDLREGQVAICPAGLPHRMGQGDAATVHSFAHFLAASQSGTPGPARGQNGASAQVLCGGFVLRSTPLNPILAAMPQVMVIDGSDAGGSATLPHVLAMLEHELGRAPSGSFAVSRLIEMLFAEALTQHAGAHDCRPGWFRGLNDTKISRALAAIHQAPGGTHSVASLAATVAMSPSRFATRFRETTGQSVMAYVVRWRMNRACRELESSQKGLEQIALEVGYFDPASFSRAFKAAIGVSPARWRRERG